MLRGDVPKGADLEGGVRKVPGGRLGVRSEKGAAAHEAKAGAEQGEAAEVREKHEALEKTGCHRKMKGKLHS